MNWQAAQKDVEQMPQGGTPLDYAPPEPSAPVVSPFPPGQRLRRVGVVLVAMAAGISLGAWRGDNWGDGMDYGLMFALVAALIGPLRRGLVAGLDRIRYPSPRVRAIIALCIGLAAGLLSYSQARRVDRELVPHWHDEHSYLLQAQHLARFRLWVTPPSDWPGDFFESFHIFTQPVYCSVYWPGAALMNVPGVWLGLPTFVMPLVIYGATVALIYLLTARICDSVAGIMAAMMATAVLEYYSFSTRIMSQVPTALLGGLVIWSWLCWREARGRRRLLWMAPMGLFAGWLGITRPVDGLAFALPVGAAVLGTLVIDFWRHDAPRPSLSRGLILPLARTAAVGVGFALPFLALQAYFNYGVTGNVMLPPYVQYFKLYHPGFEYASAGLVDRTDLPAPQTSLPQKLHYYEQFIAKSGLTAIRNSAWEELRGWRIPTLLSYSFPGQNFFGFAAAGVVVGLGLYGWMPGTARRMQVPVRMLAAVVGFFLALYVYNPLFLTHYSIALAVVTLPLAAVGLRAVEESAGGKVRELFMVLVSGAMLAWFAISIEKYPEIYHPALTEVTFAEEDAPRMIEGRGLVLVRFMPRSNIHNEPVYNSHVAFPDQSRIIWAHELGPRTVELLRYYARRDPDRQVFLMIRPYWELYPMGTVGEALALFEAGRWPLPPAEVLNPRFEEAPAETLMELFKTLPPPLPFPEDTELPRLPK